MEHSVRRFLCACVPVVTRISRIHVHPVILSICVWNLKFLWMFGLGRLELCFLFSRAKEKTDQIENITLVVFEPIPFRLLFNTANECYFAALCFALAFSIHGWSVRLYEASS
jgi:hypothetical protein